MEPPSFQGMLSAAMKNPILPGTILLLLGGWAAYIIWQAFQTGVVRYRGVDLRRDTEPARFAKAIGIYILTAGFLLLIALLQLSKLFG